MLIVKKIKNQGKREMSYVFNENLDKKAKPLKSLSVILKQNSGRNNQGKITIRHRGGRVKVRYRIIDFSPKDGSYEVIRMEKDPNRSSFIALVEDSKDPKKQAYLLATDKMKKGDVIKVGKDVEIKEGNRTILKRMPSGTLISSIELYPSAKSQIVRSGGSFGKMMGCENGMAQVLLPSGEVRLFQDICYATIGQASNPENNVIRIGKAGRTRHMGRRPGVRGKAMNPVDHPHGGGEGNQPTGLKYPKTPWGKPALGKRTRKRKHWSNRLIVKRRK